MKTKTMPVPLIIATAACQEGQPLPLVGCDATTVADFCEGIAQGHEAERRWRKCATAYRMACWYHRKARQ